MTPFLQAWSKTGRIEGGYSNHPSDPGGETMYGITARVARVHGYAGPMRDLPYPLALTIAKTAYWDALRLDDVHALSPAIARKLFDINLNMWFGAAAKFLQRSLNALNRRAKDYADITVDGDIGNKTLEALKAFLLTRGQSGEAVLHASIECLQGADYLRQTEVDALKEDFYFGWLWKRICEEKQLPEDHR